MKNRLIPRALFSRINGKWCVSAVNGAAHERTGHGYWILIFSWPEERGAQLTVHNTKSWCLPKLKALALVKMTSRHQQSNETCISKHAINMKQCSVLSAWAKWLLHHHPQYSTVAPFPQITWLSQPHQVKVKHVHSWLKMNNNTYFKHSL